MKSEGDFLDLLRRKKERLFDVYCITKDTVLRETDDEEDAETYIQLMDARKELIEEMKQLDSEMALPEYSDLLKTAESSFKEQESALRQEIKTTAERIISLDKEMSLKIPKIKAHFQAEVKELNISKNMRSVYERDYIFSEGYYVDKKK